MGVGRTAAGGISLFDRNVPRKPRLVGGVKGHNITKFPLREAPPRGRGASLRDRRTYQRLFCNRNGSGHSFVASSAKVITVKGENTRLLRNKPHPGHFSRTNIAADFQARAAEAV